MQSVINSVKGTALGVAEYLTPVLKVIFELYFPFFSPLARRISVVYRSRLDTLVREIVVEQWSRQMTDDPVIRDIIDEIFHKEMNKR